LLNSNREKYTRNIIEEYTSRSAHLCNQKNHQTVFNTFGKNTNISIHIHIPKNTKKCKALNLSFLATSTASIKMIIAEMIKNICSKFINNPHLASPRGRGTVGFFQNIKYPINYNKKK